MSGVDIDHGGAISVDPEALREVAAQVDALVSRYDDACDAIRRALRLVLDEPELSRQVDTGSLWASAVRAIGLREESSDAVTSTLLMADVYEYVELQALADALAVHDAAAADDLRLRAEHLAATDDRIAGMAAMLVREWEDSRYEGLDAQAAGVGGLSSLVSGMAFVGSVFGLGVVTPGTTLTGKSERVTVTPVKTSSLRAGPTSIADSLRRMPSADGAQIAVEKYTYAGGKTKYVAYLAGTKSPLFGATEPWDMKSNLELYSNETSASYQATLDALEAAGAEPGDEVDVVAHSQSGMIAAHLSMESEYDVKVQITAGSPVEPTLDDDQTLVQLRHTDDPVSALAGGGSPGGQASDQSFTVSRVGDPLGGAQDAVAYTHWLPPYIETAEMADASGDPRVEALDEFWSDLNRAETVERTEYRAERSGRTHR